MLNSTRKPIQLYELVEEQNELKEVVKSYKPLATIEASIALNSFNEFEVNNLKLKDCNFIGITNSLQPRAGMKLGDFYINWVLPMGAEQVLFLKELRSNG